MRGIFLVSISSAQKTKLLLPDIAGASEESLKITATNSSQSTKPQRLRLRLAL